MQVLADVDRERPVGDIANDDVAEEIRLVRRRRVGHDEAGRPEAREVVRQPIEVERRRIRAGQPGRREAPADDARHLCREALGRLEPVDALEDEVLEARRQVGRASATKDDLPDELLDVERVPVCALGHRRDRCGVRLTLGHVREKHPRQRGSLLVGQLGQLDLAIGRDVDGPVALGRPIGEDEQDGHVRDRPGKRREEVARQRVDPVKILERDADRAECRPATQRSGEDLLEHLLAHRCRHAASGIVVVDRKVEHGRQQRCERKHRRCGGGQRRDERIPPSVVGRIGRQAEQRVPDGLPGQVRDPAALGLALAGERREAFLARPPDRRVHQARLAHAGLGGECQQAALPVLRRSDCRVDGVELLRSTDHRQRVARLGQRRARRGHPDELAHRDRRRTTLDGDRVDRLDREAAVECRSEGRGHERLAGPGARHEPGREVHGVPCYRVRRAETTGVEAGVRAAEVQPDPQVALPAPTQLVCRRDSPADDIAVGHRRTEHGEQVARPCRPCSRRGPCRRCG